MNLESPNSDSFQLLLARALFAVAIVALAANYSTAQIPIKVPDHPAQVMLIRNTLTAVNHGNLTGNFTVLRDLASERFRNQHNAGELATTFASLKKQELDLSPTLVIEPKFTQHQMPDGSQRMQLVGHFPTRPKAVKFELTFQATDKGWGIDDIAVSIVPNQPSTPTGVTQASYTPAATHPGQRVSRQQPQHYPVQQAAR